jgi:competence protein ComEC
MWQYRVRKLERLILTHLHPDHASGYFRIREAFPETPVFYNGLPVRRDVAPDMVRWVNEALAADPRSERLAAGDHMQWHDSVIDVLWPSEFRGSNLNRHSLVLSIHYGETSVLVMGDTDAEVEDALLARDAIRPADILIAGHHGSADTSTAAFLAAVRASHAVISVDHDNIRGYPAATTLARLRKYSGEVLRTDTDGEICFELSGRTVRQSRCASYPIS